MQDVNADLHRLIHAWCAREELKPLSRILPRYLGNNGLTDGWSDLLGAVRDTIALCQPYLQSDELETLRDVRAQLQKA